jgi:hypothetical protein
MADPRGRRRGKRFGGVDPTPEEILERCIEALNSPPTDWDEIYFYIRSSPLGVDFPAEKFVKTPINVITKVMQEATSIQQYRANLEASTTAKLISKIDHVVHAWFQVSGDCKSEPKDHLPFPDFDTENAKKASKGPSRATELVLRDLITKYRIPMHVFVALMKPGES